MRADGRKLTDLRPVRFHRHFTRYAPGSVLVEFGETRVLCTASIDENVPPFLNNSGRGWVTAEYSMLPAATHTRRNREGRRGPIDGRTQEIQRFIGRALRAAVDMTAMGERTIWLDCDVLQADGGTRTTAINGAYVALVDAFRYLVGQRTIKKSPIRHKIGAISVGMLGDDVVSDLDYSEDSKADVDMNVVMTDAGSFIEVQGVAEGAPFPPDKLQAMLGAATDSIQRVFELQDEALREL